MGSKEFSDQTTVTHENVMRPPRGDAQSTNPCPSCVRQNCEYVFLSVLCYIRDISISLTLEKKKLEILKFNNLSKLHTPLQPLLSKGNYELRHEHEIKRRKYLII